MSSSSSIEIHENRRHSRVSCDLPFSGAEKIRNLSEGGIYFESPQNYVVDQALEVSFVLPIDSSAVLLQTNVRIVRRQKSEGQRYGYGAFFENLNPALRKQIGRFVFLEEIYSKVRGVFFEMISTDLQANFNQKSSVIQDLRIDSLKVAELSILLEQNFNQSIFLPDWLTSKDDPSELTVASLVHYLADQEMNIH